MKSNRSTLLASILLAGVLGLGCSSSGVETYKCPECLEGQWVWENPLPQGNSLNGVWGSGPDDVWAVGDLGTVLHWDGYDWSIVYSGTASNLKAVWGSGPDNIWAIGAQGPSRNNLSCNPECGGRDDCVNSIVHWDGTSWSEVFSGMGYALLGIWGSGPDDVWVVGGHADSTYTRHWVILNWNGTLWSEVTSGTEYELHGIWGSGPDDVWAVGGRSGAKILHWNGDSWSEVLIGDTEIPSPVLHGIWGSGSDEVWAIGGNLDITGYGAILRWNETSWSQQPIGPPEFQQTVGPPLNNVWGSGSDDVWTIGEGRTGGYIFHWDGTSWSSIIGGYEDVAPYKRLRGIWGSGPEDVWAVGEGGTIIHWNGIEWSSASVRTESIRQFSNLRDIWGSGPDDIWAAGGGSVGGAFDNLGLSRGGTLVHWNGNTWTTEGIDYDARVILGFGMENAWVFAIDATLRWNGTTWSEVEGPPVGGHAINGAWGSGPNDIWIVGNGGDIYHWTGYEWLEITNSMRLDWLGIWGSGPDDVWAVGEEGIIMRWNGVSWSDVYTCTGYKLHGIWGSGPNDVWVVGGEVDDDWNSIWTILHWNGTSWSEVLSGTGFELQGIWGTGPDDVWAVGEIGTTLHWNGNNWCCLSSGTTNNLSAVWGIGPDETGQYKIYAAGENGTILRYLP